ncbi:YdiU family protein [Thermosynechococcaceae cyanobacterium BACA0444]|uniref:Protein nucleotidyltransferase YdiU n=1 Tax=Pseudocalidococcus azoricus BACA0444 TaxID=2918990 RepID=A0AAE4FUA4_9CYAN|nr:YdiU family protein [Pseudocalidococcus azoricus]MDS3861010.1 YdiU family protein [Pseudocalidococcus azoricus BACA0444]
MNRINPFLGLDYLPAFQSLGDLYSDPVAAAEFPQHLLRFRNNQILGILGLDPDRVTDEDFIAAFGKFQDREPLLAMRYHGYQFGEYNPRLGDGRGFLYGQVRGQDGELYDFGTKGSGTTPYSRGGDGRLTLKGGVREVLASEMLARLGVRTSRALSLIETGEQLWRGDEPSPTRSAVLVRFSRSHIRFGTFERLHALQRPDLIPPLLDHVLEYYYPHLLHRENPYLDFYQELVTKTAKLVAQWMAAGFCHAVLNTDNMSITGESFDYGPFAFIPTYDTNFTAAYFDHYGRYSYGNQPGICVWNLEMLQRPLAAVIDAKAMAEHLEKFAPLFQTAYIEAMIQRLGLPQLGLPAATKLVQATGEFLATSQVGYSEFFVELRKQFNPLWRVDAGHILAGSDLLTPLKPEQVDSWQMAYFQALNQLPESELANIQTNLKTYNSLVIMTRPTIEQIWEAITEQDDWGPFNQLILAIQA